MDWERRRQEEDERLKEIELIKEFRKRFGIDGRSPQSFWISITSSLLLIILTIALAALMWPLIVNAYNTDPIYQACMIKGAKYAALFSVPAAICSAIYMFFRR